MTTWPKRLSRKKATQYLREEHGLEIGAHGLDRHAVRGTGPAYSLFRKTSYYTPEDLDRWISASMRPGIPSKYASSEA